MAEDSPKFGEGNQAVPADMPHHMARTPLGKIVLGSLGAAALLAFSVPLGLYGLGLSNIDGRPTPPIQTNDLAADTALLQRTLRSEAPVEAQVLNPWTFVGELRYAKGSTLDNGSRAVWIVVGHYDASHLKNHAMMWWHLSGAALMIWVTRNWTTEEIVTAAAAIVRMQPKEPAPIKSEQAIEIRLSSSLNSCFVVDTEIPCSDIGVKLKAMGIPSNSHIHLLGDSAVSYELVHSTLESLDSAGYSTRVGFVVP
jgi:hypothetical protein